MSALSAAESGTRIWDALSGHEAGLSSPMLCHFAGLTPAQLERGKAWLRDLWDDDRDDPIVRLRRGGEWIYSLAVLERDAHEHYERELRTQITRARREFNQCRKVNKKFPSPENERLEDLSGRILRDRRYAYDSFFGLLPLEVS